ncbi:putative ribonuclease H-like domain-containing protein, partial [Tanacetum coccineum]
MWQERGLIGCLDSCFLTNTMNYIPVSVENQVNVDAGTQEHYVAGSSEKDKEPTQEYILLPLHPHRPRISVEDVVQAAQEKPSETSPKDTAVQDSEDVAEKEEQHMLTEADQALKDDLERMTFGDSYDIKTWLQRLISNNRRSKSEFNKRRRSKRLLVKYNMLWIEAIRLFLAFASFMGFPVYQMDVKSAFPYGTIEEEVYVHQPPGFVDPTHPNKVYKNGFRRATTPIVSNKPLVKDEDDVDVDVHVYRFQVTPKALHLNAVKRIFRYLKHQPKLGLWYPRDSPFELEAFLDSDYGGASLNRKSTTGGCQFLSRRLISWQCKKQTIVANSTTEAEYVAAANFSMANLEVVDQHNMVACLEKTKGNSDFHEIVDFLASSSIHHALTVSPTIYTSYIEQFWNTASSQTVNDLKQIDATVDSKAVVVTEASIRSSLLFNDADVELGEPFNDVYPTPSHNLKVFTNMSRKGLKLSGKITPLFPNMLTHAVEGEGSGEPTEPQPTPSPTQPSTGDQPPKTSPNHATTQDSIDSLEGTNRNKGDQELSVLCINLSNRVLDLESIKDAQAAEISALKSRIKKLEKKCKPSISHHKAWLKSVKRLSMKKRFGKKESYMETEEAVDEGRQSGESEEVKLTDDTEVVEDKSSGDKGGNAKELVSTARPEVSTTRPYIDAARQEDS